MRLPQCVLGRPPIRNTTGIVQPWSRSIPTTLDGLKRQDEAPTRKVVIFAWILNLPRSGLFNIAFSTVRATPLPALSSSAITTRSASHKWSDPMAPQGSQGVTVVAAQQLWRLIRNSILILASASPGFPWTYRTLSREAKQDRRASNPNRSRLNDMCIDHWWGLHIAVQRAA